MKNLTAPLMDLIDLINKGVEFPDAIYRVKEAYGLTEKDTENLKILYDIKGDGHGNRT